MYHIRIKTAVAKIKGGILPQLIEKDAQNSLIDFAWRLKKEGLKEATIQNYVVILKTLTANGAKLHDAESIKETLTATSWAETTKSLAASAYKKYASLNGIEWTAPRFRKSRRLPFIPLEQEIDDFINCSGKKMGTLLQLLKETGMRIGEAMTLKWDDIDFEKSQILLNAPLKGGESRAFKISSKLISRLHRLRTNSNKVFPNKSPRTVANNFIRQRLHVAEKLNNPRILKIHFHTLRHWYASTQYFQTKDILYVMRQLGHKNIANTLLYTHLIEEEKNEEFTSAVATSIKDAQKLIEGGFTFVCKYQGSMLFKKRK